MLIHENVWTIRPRSAKHGGFGNFLLYYKNVFLKTFKVPDVPNSHKIAK